MPIVAGRDQMWLPLIGHVGSTGSDTCYRLNVNEGSRANPARAGQPGVGSQDAILIGSDLYCVHVEGDKTLVQPPFYAGNNRGPYVQMWDGASWTLIGGASVDPDADTPASSPGDRFGPRNPRIATDGTDIFVAYYDYEYVSDSANTKWIRIAKLVAGAWVEVASKQLTGSVGSLGGSIISLAVASGVAYAVYSINRARQVLIFRSDGTDDVVDGSFNPGTGVGYSTGDADGTFVAVTTSGGRPIGIYSKNQYNQYGSLVCFDLTDGSIIREDPTPMGASPLVPYGLNRAGSNIYTLIPYSRAGYGPDGDLIVFGTNGNAYAGFFTIPEDFSRGPIVIDGNMDSIFDLGVLGSFTTDPGDDRQLWITGGTDQDIEGGGGSNPQLITAFQPSCQSQHVVGNPANTGPAYSSVISGWQVPKDGDPDDCLFGNSFFWLLYGPQLILTDGTYVYVFWLYYPGTDTGAAHDDDGASPQPSNQLQWIVSRWTIARGQITCADYIYPVFKSKFKAGETDQAVVQV